MKRRRASVICIHNNYLLLVALRDPHTKVRQLFPPGGKVESHETPEATAQRECFEETHCNVKIIPETCQDDIYNFTWDNVTYECHTSYFWAEFLNEDHKPIQDASYNEGPCWIHLDQVEKELAYDQHIQKSVMKMIELHHHKSGNKR